MDARFRRYIVFSKWVAGRPVDARLVSVSEDTPWEGEPVNDRSSVGRSCLKPPHLKWNRLVYAAQIFNPANTNIWLGRRLNRRLLWGRPSDRFIYSNLVTGKRSPVRQMEVGKIALGIHP